MCAFACVCSRVFAIVRVCVCLLIDACVCVCRRSTWRRLVSDEAACFSQQPSVCAQETINKEGISWTIAARLAPCAAWELEEEGKEERREGREGWKRMKKERKEGWIE